MEQQTTISACLRQVSHSLAELMIGIAFFEEVLWWGDGCMEVSSEYFGQLGCLMRVGLKEP